MQLELFVHYSDGRGFTEATERDDPAGRRAIDQAAFAALARPRVASVSVTRSRRVAGYCR